MLSSQYGWTKEYIFEQITFDELALLGQIIKERQIKERLLELAIVHNPHSKDPRSLYQDLLNELPKDYQQAEEIDKAGFEGLRTQLSGSMGIKVQ